MKSILTAIFFIFISNFCFSGEIASLFNKEFNESSEKKSDNNFKDGIIEKIGIEHTGCLGPCPIFTLEITSDGKVSYEGVNYVKFFGKKNGTIAILNMLDLDRTIEYLEFINYFGLSPRYGESRVDSPTTFLLVVKNGKPKVVAISEEKKPLNLWVAEQLIDNLLNKVEWAKK